MACQRAKHSGRKTFRPVFFALRKSAYRCVDNIRANLIAQKKTPQIFEAFFRAWRKFARSRTYVLDCRIQDNFLLRVPRYFARNKTTVLGCRLRCVFLAGSAQVYNRKPPARGLLALGSSFCGARENEVYEAIGSGPISPGQFFLLAPRYLAAARIL